MRTPAFHLASKHGCGYVETLDRQSATAGQCCLRTTAFVSQQGKVAVVDRRAGYNLVAEQREMAAEQREILAYPFVYCEA